MKKSAILFLGLLFSGCSQSDRGTIGSHIKELKARDPRVRKMSAVALGELGPGAAEAVAALTESLQDNDVEVRCQAANALGQIGPDATASLPALRVALKEDNEQVHRSVVLALEQIDPEAAAKTGAK